MRTETPPTVTEAPFEKEVTAVMARMRNALAEIIAAVPDNVGKGADLHRALRIDRKLSWKVFRLATAPDPVAASTLMPSPAKLESFFKAAAKRGVPQGRLEAAARVSADFEDVVLRHASDRTTFDSMVSALADDETAEQIDLNYRRLAFRGTRHALGLQAKTTLKTFFIRPSSANSKLVDVAMIEGYISLRRLRGDVNLYFATRATTNDDGSYREIQRGPIDSTPTPGGIALLKEFCSEPLPQIRMEEIEPGTLDWELVTNGVGNRAAVTCLAGDIAKDALPRYRDDQNRTANFSVKARLPSECFVFDLLVRDDTYNCRLTPHVLAYSEHFRPIHRSGPNPSSHRIPLHAPITYIGKGASVLHSPGVPRYAEMGRHVFDRLGWNGDRFEVYRCHIEYPNIPSVLGIRFDLPEAPST